jgi:hypothetical protein
MSNWINHVNNLYTVQKCVLPSEKENLLEFYNNSSESEQEELNSDPVLHSELILKSLRKNADFTSGSLGVQEKEKGGMSDFNLTHFKVYILLINISLIIGIGGSVFLFFKTGDLRIVLGLLFWVYAAWVQIKLIRVVIYLKKKL